VENSGCLLGVILGLAILFGYAIRKGVQRSYDEEKPRTRQYQPITPGEPPSPKALPQKPEPAPAGSAEELPPEPEPTPSRSATERTQHEAGPVPGHGADVAKQIKEMDLPAADDRADLDRRLKDMDRPILDDGVDIDKLLRDMDKPSIP
jgi:hypothetical protein